MDKLLYKSSPLSSAETLAVLLSSLQYWTPSTREQRSVWLLRDVLQHPVPAAAAGQRLPVPPLPPRGAELGLQAAQPAGRDPAARRWRELETLLKVAITIF